MTSLANNIKHYMSRKSIPTYTRLLIDIAYQLNIHGKDAYKFAEREKANFSKMMKGKRPLKYDFIVPLEKVLGVSLAKLLDEDAYKLEVDRNEVPIVKGFRYYAYMNDYDLCKRDLDKFLTKQSESVIGSLDEFGKTLLDYVVEYGSINVIRFLRDQYHIKLALWNNQFQSTLDHNYDIFIHNPVELARLVINSGDIQLFNDIYDPYYQFAMRGDFFDKSLWENDDFLEILLDKEDLFESLFEPSRYKYEYSRLAKKRYGIDSMDFTSINPLLNTVLKYTINNLDKYKDEAIKILRFGIKHNEEVFKALKGDYHGLSIDECGGLRQYKTNEILDLLIIVKNKEIEDKEIIEFNQRLIRPIKSIGLEYFL